METRQHLSVTGNDKPIVTKIAFVVNRSADPGKEIVAACMSIKGQACFPLQKLTVRKETEYWRKVFLLFAKYYERLHILGPVEGWPKIAGQPVLIHANEGNYPYWSFLATYWHWKTQQIKDDRRPELRAQQQALANFFRAGGRRSPAAWISVNGEPLAPESILLCDSFDIWKPYTKDSSEISDALFEKRRITDPQEVRNLLMFLKDRIRNTEFCLHRGRKARRTWLTSYKEILVSQVPEWPIAPTLRELDTRDLQKTEEGIPSGTRPVVSPRDLLESALHYRFVLVTAPAGAGKSTLLTILAKEFLELTPVPPDNRTPILIRLRDFDPRVHLRFEDVVLASLKRQYEIQGKPLDTSLDSELGQWLASKTALASNTLYLLDGYNNIPYDQRSGTGSFDDLFRDFLTKHQGSVIATTQGNEHPLCFNPKVYLLQEPDDDSVIGHVQARLPRDAVDRFVSRTLFAPEYRSFARTLYLLDCLIRLALEPISTTPATASVELPNSRARILQAIVKQSLDRKFSVEGVRRPYPFVHFPVLIADLAQIAHDNLMTPARRLRLADVIPSMSPHSAHRLAIIRMAVLAGILDYVDIDAPNTAQPITFSHDLLRDYFAALHIKSRITHEPIDLRSKYLEYHRWDEPLCLFAEMCDDQQVFVTLANEIAQEDVLLASQFALRRSHITVPLLLSLIRGHCFLSEMARLPLYVRGYDGVPFEVLVRGEIISLLSCLSVSQLLNIRGELDYSCLRANAIAALGMKGRDGWDSVLKDSTPLDYRERELLLDGLSWVGSYDAFLQAGEIARSTLMGIPADNDARAGRIWFIRKCELLYRHWRGALPADHILAMIGREEDTDLRWLFLRLLDKAHFGARHIQSLLRLADVSEPADCRPVLLAIGRIGGCLAVDAILVCAERFLRMHGDIATSELTGNSLHIFLDALVATKEQYAALGRLRDLLGCQTVPHTSGRGEEDNLKLAWNYILVEVLSKAKGTYMLDFYFLPEAVNDQLIEILQRMASSKTKNRAGSILARICCLQNPERTLQEIEDMVTKRHEMRHDEKLIMGGMPGFVLHQFFDGLMRSPKLRGSEIAIACCLRLIEHKDFMPHHKVLCAKYLFERCGIRPAPGVVAQALAERCFMDFAVGEEGRRQLVEETRALIGLLSEDETIDLLGKLKNAASDCGTWVLGQYGQHIEDILDRRERRYLQVLDSWPRGIRSQPETYKPFRYEELVKALGEK